MTETATTAAREILLGIHLQLRQPVRRTLALAGADHRFPSPWPPPALFGRAGGLSLFSVD